MPAISFQKQFADAVEAGDKLQTIRASRRDGKPTATVGQTLYLYTGMRTKSCRKLGEAICTCTAQFVITEGRDMIIDGTPIRSMGSEDRFAENDGFANAGAMVDWFEEIHGLPFHGTLIEWDLPCSP